MLSIYIHVPFCVGKCRYCGFYSTHYEPSAADAYLDAIGQELAFHRNLLEGRTVSTIYVGGGTPTTLGPAQWERLFDLLDRNISRTRDAEVTVEANPASANDATLGLLRSLGVNRLSIGGQSFDDELLRWLGRPHVASDITASVRSAVAAGFENIGLDLIYGIPGQTGERWKTTLARTVSLGIQHVSCYSLSSDEGSRLAEGVRSGDVILPDEDAVLDRYREAITALDLAGFRQYELSNFAQPSCECRHNLAYWERKDYLGLGPAASSCLGDRRWTNRPDLAHYRADLSSGRRPISFEETLTEEQAAAESVMLGLRLTAGIDLAGYAAAFGTARRDALLSRLPVLERNGLVTAGNGRLRLTVKGMMLANEVSSRLIG